ncbi:MAG: VapC toxin family PIN domain ribonuclease [Acetobacteraceae bacterium]
MIVVDSSVWIGDLRDEDTPAVMKLRALDPMRANLVVPDLGLLEVLRGARDEAIAGGIERHLCKFDIVDLGGRMLAVAAARYYRHLRGLGITIRSSIHVLIGTFCIQHDAVLLHHDRGDFLPMQRHLGLRCL